MTSAGLAGLLAGWAVAVPVGAIGACLVALSATAPWRTAVAAALGVACADGAYALLAVLGGAAVTPLLTRVAGPLRLAAALVLLVLAVRTALAARRPAEAGPALPARRAFVRLLALTLVNPTTVLCFGALVVGAHGGSSLPERLVFAGSAFVASASWQLLLVGCGAALGGAVTSPRGRLATALVSSAVIAVLALDVLLRQPVEDHSPARTVRQEPLDERFERGRGSGPP